MGKLIQMKPNRERRFHFNKISAPTLGLIAIFGLSALMMPKAIEGGELLWKKSTSALAEANMKLSLTGRF